MGSTSVHAIQVENQLGAVVISGKEADFGWNWIFVNSGASSVEGFSHRGQLDVGETDGVLHIRLIQPDGKAFASPCRQNDLWWRVDSWFRRFVYSNSPGESMRSDLQIRVPRLVSVKIKNCFGVVKIVNIQGPLEIDSKNCNIDLSLIKGAITAQTSFADIKVRDVIGSVELKNQNGRIDARHIEGDIRAKSTFAGLHIEEVKGSAFLTCQNGKIEARGVSSNLAASNSFAPIYVYELRGDAELVSQNGEIIASDVVGNIRAKTSFALLQLEGRGKMFEAHNQDGAIKISALSAQVERIEASGSFGGIEVYLPNKSRPLVIATTSFGKVKSDFLPVIEHGLDHSNLNTQANSPKVTVDERNGNIIIRKATNAQ